MTLPLDQLITTLAGHPLRVPFLNLWETENNMSIADALAEAPGVTPQVAAVSTGAVYAYPRDFFKGQGTGLPMNAGGKSEDAKADWIRKNWFPFQPADAGWLMNEFLAEMYPNAGEINLCNPDVWPEDHSMWNDLRTFLGDPLYTHHPHRDTLLAACSGIKDIGKSGMGAGRKGDGPKIVRGISRLVRVLRHPMSERAEEKKSGATRRAKTVLTVGGAQSLPADAIANVEEPTLELLEDEQTTVTELDPNQLIEADDDGFELTAGDLAKLYGFEAAETGPDPTATATDQPKSPTKQVSPDRQRSKRKRSPEAEQGRTRTEVQTITRRFGDIKSMKHSFLLYCSEKYEWDYKRAEDDDMVEIEEAVAVQKPKLRRAHGMRPDDYEGGEEGDVEDDDMLIDE